MNDDQPEVHAGPVVKVARDLTEIERMSHQLDEQAEHKANASLDQHHLPGGLAMVSLAPVANLGAWHNRLATAERLGADTSWLEDEDSEWEPVLQTLCFWSEQWRAHHGNEYDQRPTIGTEANFIRWALPWAWDNLPEWDDFAQDIRDARVRMENVLYAGNRAERTRIECDQCDAKKRRLVKLYGEATDGSDDIWKCPACKHRFNAEDTSRAHAKMLRSEGAAKWVHQADAIGTLKAQGRPERTIRAWLAEGEGEAYCDPVTHECWVWWPDLWRKHLTTATRKRPAAG